MENIKGKKGSNLNSIKKKSLTELKEDNTVVGIHSMVSMAQNLTHLKSLKYGIQDLQFHCH